MHIGAVVELKWGDLVRHGPLDGHGSHDEVSFPSSFGEGPRIG